MNSSVDRLTAALSDRYHIERELGQGGMATVYLAEDLKHKRKVALKVLKPELAAVLGAERFVQEITTTAALQHPHILPLFDSGTADGFLYYVMPFIDGETLRSKLDRETQLGVDEAVKITVDVADALDYAHHQGVIHRDIKPENILLHNGRPMVADFGIALALSAAAGGRMTETGLSLGTPHYMSPEQATAEKEITARSDIYSLGSVCYEMLAGQPPHIGGSAQQIIMKIVTEEATPVTQHRKSVPLNVAAAVAKSLEKLPADRFESAKTFAEALRNPGFTVASTALGGGVAAAGRRSRINHGLAGAAVAALVLAAWGWMQTPAEPALKDSWRVALAVPDSIGLSAVPALSEDGTAIAFVGGDQRIWVLRGDGTPPTPIAGTEGAVEVSISPDGTRLAFMGVGGQLKLIPIGGGSATKITDSLSLADPVAWIDDNTLVFGSLRGLMKISASGGPITPLGTMSDDSAAAFHMHPSALPDGRGVIFTIQPTDLLDPSQARIAVVGPDGGAPTVLMPGLLAVFAAPEHLLVTQANGNITAVPFDPKSRRVAGEGEPIVTGLPIGILRTSGMFTVAPTGRLVYVTGEELNRTDLVRVRRDGTAVPIDTSRSGNFGSVAVSPDGRWAAASVSAGSADELRLRNLTTGARIRIAEPGLWLRAPLFLPDSRSLIFLGIRSQGTGLYRASVDDAAAPELIFSGSLTEWPIPSGASPDGQTIFYWVRSPGRRMTFTHNFASPDTPDRAISTGRDNESSPAPSPDGRWLVYLTDESGRPEISVRPADLSRTERWQLPRPVVFGAGTPAQPHWSRDSRELVYRSGDQIVAARIAPGGPFAITEQRVLLSATDYEPSFDLFPNGDLLMIRKRPASETPMQLIMIDRWDSWLKSRD